VVGLHLAARPGVRAVTGLWIKAVWTSEELVRVRLARGEHDPMVTTAHLEALVPDPVVLPGLGHNAHVDSPEAVAELLR
jgi:pimeloyl-ACP methyl ester carboxylesterase